MSYILRSAWLARLVLAWFVMFVGVSVAAPVFHPVSQQLVCSASGTAKLVQIDGQNADDNQQSHAMHCALCLPVSAGFSFPPVPDLSQVNLHHVLREPLPPYLASAEALSPLSRGPPSNS